MTRVTVRVVVALLVGAVLGALATHALQAQPAGIKRALLLRKELSGLEGREVVLGTAELAPGVAAGRHFHHGHELGYVLDGTAVLEVEGQPPVTLKAGDTYHVEAGRIHDARNTGGGPARVLAVWIVEKGKPLAVSAP